VQDSFAQMLADDAEDEDDVTSLAALRLKNPGR
jgi:hypothetical protein